MKVGFTGTREGITAYQTISLAALIATFEITEAHHGCCIGADAEFLRLIRKHYEKLESLVCIYYHQPEDKKHAFEIRPSPIDRVLIPRPYLTRNRNIVDLTDILLACPKTKVEERRSGTWATIRYARRSDKPIYIIFPDGEVAPCNLDALKGSQS